MKTTPPRITPVVVGVLRNSAGNYLLTDRVEQDKVDTGFVFGDDFWQLPGGGLEVGETVEEGVIREMKEETGLDVDVITLLPKIHTSIRPKWHGIIMAFLVKMKDERQRVVLNHESSRYRWFKPDEIKNLNSFLETYSTVSSAEHIAKLFF
jgi:mutator protein MutT